MNPLVKKALAATLLGGTLYPNDADAANPVTNRIADNTIGFWENLMRSRGFIPDVVKYETPTSVSVKYGAYHPKWKKGTEPVFEANRLYKDEIPNTRPASADLLTQDNYAIDTPLYRSGILKTWAVSEGGLTEFEANQLAKERYLAYVSDVSDPKRRTTRDVFFRDYSPHGKIERIDTGEYKFTPKDLAAIMAWNPKNYTGEVQDTFNPVEFLIPARFGGGLFNAAQNLLMSGDMDWQNRMGF